MNTLRRILSRDPRLYQIATLAGLLLYGMIRLGFDITPPRAALLIGVALATQFALTRLFRLPSFDPRSPTISALSLCLLLRTNSHAIAAVAAFVTIASKFLLRWNGKHLFNPTNFALAAAIAATGNAWVSPGQWGSAAFFAFGIACVGRFVVQRAARGDVTLAYIAVSVLFVTGRSLALGEPLGIPLHRLESGALLLFAFFMISDPKTTPDSRIGRILFGALVAAGAAYIQFRLFRPNGAIWSLAFFSLFVPLFDLLWPGPRWNSGVAPFPRKGDFHAPLLRLRPRPDSLVRRPVPSGARLLRLLRREGGHEAL